MQVNIEESLKNLVPISEAPTKISIAEKTLRNWRAKGMYGRMFIKLGGKVFVDLSEFARIVEIQKEKASKESRRLGFDD
jgi:hypothetical protein